MQLRDNRDTIADPDCRAVPGTENAAPARSSRIKQNARVGITTLTSFDGGVVERVEYQRPDRYHMIEADLGDRPRIARGGGYSYAAASFGAGSLVQEMTRFNRVLRFDPGACLIEVEAGMTLGDLLNLTAPVGLWLPVQPGYPAITVGGCIAAEVHGKNPAREGTFTRSIVDLTVFHPSHGTVRVDPERTPLLFDLTCGGYGLTGVILTATLRLDPLPGTLASVRRIPVGTLAEGLALLRASASHSPIAYTWHGVAPVGRTFGRGIVYEGALVPGPPVQRNLSPHYNLLTAKTRARFPFSLWGRLTTQAVNSIFSRLESRRQEHVDVPLFDSLFPFARRAVYFRLYGRRGLAESQMLIPQEQVEGFLVELQQCVLKTKVPAVMMSLKLFKGTQRFLRFDGEGVCITLDLVRSPQTLAFLSMLDELIIAARGIPNVIKDSRLPRAVVRACYPQYEIFQDQLYTYDPARIFRSELSERLGL